MRRPSGDSYGRSSSGLAAGRAAALLAVAVVLGIILLNAADDTPSTAVSTGTDDTTPDEVTTSTLPTTTIVTLPPRTPADVKIIAANGTDVKGVAKRATDQLKAAGYNVLSPTDASAKAQSSAIYYAGDFVREAEVVAVGLGLPPTAVQPLPTPPPLADARGANLVLVVGPELAAQLAASATPSTTAAGAGTSATTTTTKP